MIKTVGFLILIIAASVCMVNLTQANDRVELGKVTWNRDLDKAKALSAKTGKPLFVQFQEVPG